MKLFLITLLCYNLIAAIVLALDLIANNHNLRGRLSSMVALLTTLTFGVWAGILLFL